ncbi:galactokinase [Selenomonas sp. oral taxon 136]|uniref:galactokinase n=1 Tax=Selenomonas sp. oral taxon 136 TaxID=713030 RepID=UPI0007682E01|nr:galactokinase [Selenomonas sp. oral taxon 136]AME03116.1 galactokinase [Selenomonas sp. oral taxon 136]
MKILDEMQEVFREKFGAAQTHAYFSPGRVNLIGEHTDYNGGHVFPCAISLGTYALVAPRTDGISRLYSMNLPEQGVVQFPMHGAVKSDAYGWANYPIGVVRVMEDAGHRAAHGFDIVLYGTLPNGAGLSSSASIEVLMAVILNDELNLGIDMVELVKFSQKAENEFVGMNCGIMDQFAVGMGKKDCAILLDCNTLSYRYSKLALDGCSIVITNTNKTHSLVTSAYNERRTQCESALKAMQKVKPIKALGELTNAEFDAIASAIPDPVERRRARHAVYENNRTLEAVKALEANDVKRFGELMNASHVSLRDDYEVTGPELDTLAELAWQQDGVLGSRMTGGGFAGCTVSIVRDAAIPAFEKNVGEAYTAKIGYAPSFYVANIADGARRLS